MLKYSYIILFFSFFLTSNNTAIAGDWTELPAFTGGDVYSICLDSAGNVYAGTKSGFIFKSTDNGESWTEFFSGLEPAYHVSALISDIEYLETGILLAAVQNQGCFVLDLNAQTHIWVKLSLTPKNIDFIEIQTDNNIAYAISNKSNQIDFFVIEHISGTNFDIAGKNYPGLVSQFMVANNEKIFLLDANENGLFITTDKGNTWKKDEGQFSSTKLYLFSPGRERSEFFLLDRDFNLYLTQDNGDSWIEITGSETLNGVFVFNAIIFSDDSIILFTNNGTYSGNLNSDSWELINREVFSFMQIQKNDYVYSTKEQKALLISSDKGNTWKEFNEGMTALNIIDMTEGKDTTFFAISKKHIYRLFNGEDEWEVISPDTVYNDYTIIRSNKHDFIYVGTQGKKLMLSLDNGNTLDTIYFNLGNTYFVKELLFLPNEDIIMHCRENAYNFLISKDLGYDWNYFNIENIPVPITNNFYMSVAVDSSNGVYIGALNNFIFQTDDEGDYWKHIFNYNFTPYDIEINSQFNIYCIAYKDAIQHKIYYSLDQGDNWDEIPYFTGTSSKTIADILVYENKIIVNYKDAVNLKDEVYISEDWGETWDNISDDELPYINKLYFKYDFLYACTTKGIYRYSDQIVSVEGQSKTDELSLYPNPAKNILNISANFSFNNSLIRVYSIEGKLLIKENTGYTELSDQKIDVNSLPTGIYILEILNNEKIISEIFIKY